MNCVVLSLCSVVLPCLVGVLRLEVLLQCLVCWIEMSCIGFIL